jgi:hypothetical protein
LLQELATKHLQESQDLLDVETMRVQFGHKQCRYLVERLETAVQSARHSMHLFISKPVSRSEQVSVSEQVSSMDDRKFTRKWKFLIRLAMDVKSFVQECCKKEYWIQAACILMNAFEHVASLSTDLDICIWSFEGTGRIMLETALRKKLTRISDAQDRRLDAHVKLMKKAEATLQKLKSISTLEERQLAISLLGELEENLCNNTAIPDQPDELADLSFRDEVDLLKKVEAALGSYSISDPEERQLATSLVERYRAAVGSPIPGEPVHSDFMKVHDSSACLNRDLENRWLGNGAFGEVNKVKWLGISAAEKTLPEGNEGELPIGFVQEVSILARLSHPSIVRLLCYVNEGLKCSVVLELMDRDLTGLIKEMELNKNGEPPFSIDEVIDIMLQTAEGMDYLHRRRVLHRDLKSQNILVKREKLEAVDAEFIRAKVADFGISKTKERSITLHHPTWNQGTTRWMAPELINLNRQKNAGNNDNEDDGFAKYPFRSDVFSFGMVCFEILTGDMPFANLTPNEVKNRLLEGDRPPLPAGCPSYLACMIKMCWRAKPEERPSFAEICRELRVMKGSLLMG